MHATGRHRASGRRAWGLLGVLLAASLVGCSGDDSAGAPGAATSTMAVATTTSRAAAGGASTTGGDSSVSASTAPTATTPSVTTASTSPSPPTTGPPVLVQVRAELRQLARFEEPVAMAVRPGTRLIYVVERVGRVQAMHPDGTVVPRPVADLTALTAPGGERGLLGLAFSPDGERLYVNYTDTNGDTNVDELTLGVDGLADPASRRRVLFVAQPYANHNGGHLQTGPDGMLYIGMGDGGSGGDPQGNGQDLGTLLGKLLRIDPTPDGDQPYTVPADNPFVGQAGARPEIWSYGLRNPWGFTFDPPTGDLWLADVGQDEVEEIDVARAADTPGGAGRGVNFGWNAYEGTSRYDSSVDAPGALAPIHEYEHGSGSTGGCSVTGGVIYHGSAVANLGGAYLFGDYCVAGIRAIETSGEPQARVLLDQPSALAGFATDPDGEVLVASLDGAVYRLG